MGQGDWTAERVRILKAHWKKDMSASYIADLPEMAGLSRNAVIDKAQRLGLGVSPPPPTTRAERAKGSPRKRHQAKVAAKRAQTLADAGGGRPALSTTGLRPRLTVVSSRITMIDLTDRTCRYPFGERARDLTFCGAPPIEGSPYCAEHEALCHVPWTPKIGTSAA
jgi:GcrA cell cycle regulator